MDNRWTLRVERFGGIRSAEISPAPLTLFVGDNNSGKSYLMTLLYALMKMNFYGLFRNVGEDGGEGRIEDTREYRLCRDWVINAMVEIPPEGSDSTRSAVEIVSEAVRNRESGKTASLTDETVSLFENLLNLVLRLGRERVARWAFNDEAVQIGNLSVSLPRLDRREIALAYFCGKDGAVISAARCDALGIERVSVSDGMDNAVFFTLANILYRFLAYPVFTNSLKYKSPELTRFLPISRTGFLLNRRTLASDAVSRAYNIDADRTPPSRMTRPCSEFLRDITGIDAKSRRTRPTVIPFMERNMIRGAIRVTDEHLQEIQYHPDGSDREIPMFLSSGVVTELAPLMLVVQYYDVGGLFIEEPETCLHPALQRNMARVLVRLSNADTPVFATTHSDTILQHINNMVKLWSLPEEQRNEVMARYGFEQADLIPSSRVAMYQFDDTPDGTEVTPLTCGDYGFVIPTINDALHDLLDQTRDTEPDEPDDGETQDE